MSTLNNNSGLFLGTSAGVFVSWLVSHPTSPAKSKIRPRSIRNVHYSPNLRIKKGNHHYHIHHWMYFGALFTALLGVRRLYRGNRVLEGFVLGLVLHGLTYKDRFKVKHNSALVIV